MQRLSSGFRMMFTVALAATPSLIATPAGAGEITSVWTGNGATNRWAEAANWNPVGVPNNSGGTTYHVVIEGEPDEDVEVIIDTAPINVQTLTIHVGDTVKMNAPGSLFIRGGLLHLDGTLQINPLNIGLARLFFLDTNAQVTGLGEIQMLGEPGRCLLQVGGGIKLTLGDSDGAAGSAAGGVQTVLRGSGVVQGASGSSLDVLERVISDIDGVDLIFLFLTLEVDDVIEAIDGLLSFVNCNVSGSGSIENNGSNIVGVRDSTFDGSDGLSLLGALELFADAIFLDAFLSAGSLGINKGSTATLDNVTMNQVDIDGHGDGSVNIAANSTTTMTDVNIANANVSAQDQATLSGTNLSANSSTFIGAGPGAFVFALLGGNAMFEDVQFDDTTIDVSPDATVNLSNVTISDSTIEGDPDSEDDSINILTGSQWHQVLFRWGNLNLPPDAMLTVSDTTVENANIQGNPNAPSPQVIVNGEWIVSDTTLIDVSGEVANNSTFTINNVFFDATTFTGGIDAILQMQAQARIDNGTFDTLDLILTGEPFIMTANGPLALKDLTLAIDGQTQVETDTGATLEIKSANITGTDKTSAFQADPDIHFVFDDGDAIIDAPTTTSGNFDALGFGKLIIEEEFVAEEVFVGMHKELTLNEILVAFFIGLELHGRADLRRVNVAMKRLEATESADLQVDADPNLAGGGEDFSIIEVEDSFEFAMADEAKWIWGPDSTLAMTGGVGAQSGEWDQWCRLEVGGADLGDDPATHQGNPAGFENNFDLSILRIGEGAHVYLEDAIDNGNRAPESVAGGVMSESLYVDVLEFADSTGRLNLNGINLYYGAIIGDPSQIIDVPVDDSPEPGDLNDDMIVDEADRAILCSALGSATGEPQYIAAADLNDDGVIDHLDQQLFNDILPPCAGDAVSSDTFAPPADGVTDGADLAYLLGAWGNAPSCADFVTSKSFAPPPDGMVDGADLAYLLGEWGACE